MPIIAPMHMPPGWQAAPGQQAPPTAPQFMQVLGSPFGGFAHPKPDWQLLPAQQG
jgi:hypothetical protein